MVLIIKDNKVVAKLDSNKLKDGLKAAEAIEAPCELIKSAEELTSYSGKDLAELYNSLSPLKLGSRAKDKAKVAQKVWELAKKLMVEKPAAVKNNTASAEKEVKKVGIKQQLREMFVAGEKATLEELLAKFGEDKKASITTALSDLKSKKYAGEGGALNIVKDAGKCYSLEVASA